ncbi:MAG: hypothetical protein KAJ10_15255, partial [Thermodesulfovibrionia bacterium]|nr:hypothetical protein [Thermodesulfovibrionia bacterium]
GRKMLASYMSVINVIPNASSVVFRKKVFEQAGGADKEMKLCGDWLTWSKMLLISDIAFVAQPLNYFRVHHGTVRNRVHGRQRYVQEYIDVVQFIFDKVTVGRLSKRRSAYQLKARWLRVVNENPKDITLGGIKAVFKKSHRLFGMFQAVIFFGIGFWALTNLLSINIPVIRSVKRAMRNSILRIAQP